MDEKIIEMLSELLEGQRRLEAKMDGMGERLENVEEELKDMRESLLDVEIITAKNWRDVIFLKNAK